MGLDRRRERSGTTAKRRAPRGVFILARGRSDSGGDCRRAGVCLPEDAMPWLIGPLVAVPPPRMATANRRTAAGARSRSMGHRCALGLYFSPDVVREIVRLSPWIAVAVIFSIVLGWLGCWLLTKAVGADAPTSFSQWRSAVRPRWRRKRNAMAARLTGWPRHALRIMLVVLIVPFAFNAMNVHGLDPYTPLAKTFSWTGFVVLVAITAGAAVMQRVRSPNSWMIGPLLASALITATGHSFSSFPAVIVNAGQLLIGISLGRALRRSFSALRRAFCRRLLRSLLYMLLAAGFAALLARGSGLPWPTATIATTPGGIGEMALTAQALQLGVPIVTAFHTIRLLALLLTVGAMYRYWQKWMARRAS